jgi:lipopolysaccharide transport system permease protein
LINLPLGRVAALTTFGAVMLFNEICALWRSRSLVWVLTQRELAARNAGSIAGALWLYLPPLLTVAAYYLVFDIVFSMRLGAQAPVRSVGAYLIAGALPWMAFCDAINRGMGSLIDAGGLLQKNPLPPALFPARSVLASGVVFGPLIAVVTLAYAPLHHWSPALLALLPLAALQLLLCWVLGYLLAILAAALRDILALVGFLLSVGIYLSPVLFPVTLFPENWRWVLWINPMSPLIGGYQSVLLTGDWPALTTWGITLAWIVVTGGLLSLVIRRSREQLVDWL